VQQAVSKNDTGSLALVINAATTLKGGAASLSASSLALFCDEIEQTARRWTLAEARPLIEWARQEFERVQTSFSPLISGSALFA